MALVPEIDVQLVFRPFELDPTIPEGGVDYKAYMREKFGSDVGKERSNAMRDALIQYGEDEGIPYNFDKITWRPNSLNAHRLVRWAQGQDLGAEAKEALFKAFFEDGRNIGDINELTDIGASVGLHRDVLETLYASNADEDEVRKEAAIFRQMGVSGVPTYIAHRSIAVQGAESAEKLAKFLTRPSSITTIRSAARTVERR